MPHNSEPIITVVGLPGSGVEILISSSPGFDEELRATVEEASIAALRPVLRYVAIVRNGTKQGVPAVMVRYERVEESGKTIPANAVLLTTRRLRAQMILPGERALFAPLSGFSALARNRLQIRNISSSAAFAEGCAKELARFPRVDISLDAVVFEDGRLIGPDHAGLQERMESYLRAEKLLLDGLTGLSRSARKDFLENILRDPEPAVTYESAPIDWYTLHLRSTAQAILSLLNNADSEDQFVSWMNSMIGEPMRSPQRILSND